MLDVEDRVRSYSITISRVSSRRGFIATALKAGVVCGLAVAGMRNVAYASVGCHCQDGDCPCCTSCGDCNNIVSGGCTFQGTCGSPCPSSGYTWACCLDAYLTYCNDCQCGCGICQPPFPDVCLCDQGPFSC